MSAMRFAIAALLGLAFAGAAYVAGDYSRDLAVQTERVASKSAVVGTRFGRLEYAVAGRGRPLLMIHGTGGGFDQGLASSDQIVARGHLVIAPSRFGYLRSDFPADPSPEAQADALAELLDRLEVERIAVAGASAGAASAIQFALRHPRRTAALILIVPAANLSGRDPAEMGAAQEWLVRRLLKSDFLYWMGVELAPSAMTRALLATDPELVARASPAEQARIRRILVEIAPIGQRWRGMLSDAWRSLWLRGPADEALSRPEDG